MPDLASPDAKAQERHHFYRLQSLLVSLRETHIPSKISTFFDSKSFGTPPPTTTHIHLILIPVVAYYGPSDAPEHLFTSGFLHRCRLIAVARNWTCGGEKSLAELGTWGNCAGASKHPARARVMRWNGHSDWSDWYAGWMDGWMGGWRFICMLDDAMA